MIFLSTIFYKFKSLPKINLSPSEETEQALPVFQGEQRSVEGEM
jgi:hypothetical protein